MKFIEKPLQFSALQNDETKFSEQKNYGRYILLCRDQQNQPKYMLGPHYYIFIIAFITCTVLFCLLMISLHSTLSTIWFIILIIFVFIFELAYLNVGFSVPGIASQVYQLTMQQKKSPKYCKPCKIVRSIGTVHCYDCDVCIEGYDHHCPWIGKCVGKKNLRAFYFFLFSCFLTLIMCFIAVIVDAKTVQNKTINH